jgi:hypothetical protein
LFQNKSGLTGLDQVGPTLTRLDWVWPTLIGQNREMGQFDCDNGHALSRTSAWQRYGHKVSDPALAIHVQISNFIFQRTVCILIDLSENFVSGKQKKTIFEKS